MLLVDGREEFTQLSLIGELRSPDDLRGAFHIDFMQRAFAKCHRIPESEGAACDGLVAFAFGGEFLQQVSSDGLKSPTAIMAIKKIGRGIQLFLGEEASRAKDLVASVTTWGDQDNDDAAI